MKTTAPSPLRRLVGAAATLALTLAGLTAAAMPARADNDDLAKALAAIAALAIIAKTIDDNDRGYRPPPVYHPHPRPHPVPEPVRRVLPTACAIELNDRGDRDVWYLRPCLRDHGIRVDLPRRCEAEVRIRGRKVGALRQDCLIDAGFRPERGRWHDDRYKHENPRKW